ncbi:Imm51 family immunity protein [Hymenobacter negativus]|uniref:DUF3303 domain-containing protein n=1 Tax=Hymenobacter negativus TaxID=2795026 RepID=A0ABS3QMM9_9BACT|nr:Imm51 family immunity protein [Hymenobacter negativus]MBO2012382.1 hypothetical protein [Hymenobacter negativus]
MFTKEKALALLCLGFFFCLLVGCRERKTTNTWPFIYYKQIEGAGQMPTRKYAIWAKGSDDGPGHLIDEYDDLFDKYGFSGNGYSLAEHIESIIQEKDAGLLTHLDFDPNGNEFLVWADSEDAVQRFMDDVLPVFGNASTMEAYLKQANPDNFSE